MKVLNSQPRIHEPSVQSWYIALSGCENSGVLSTIMQYACEQMHSARGERTHARGGAELQLSVALTTLSSAWMSSEQPHRANRVSSGYGSHFFVRGFRPRICSATAEAQELG